MSAPLKHKQSLKEEVHSLRLARDDEMTDILNLVESRKHLFSGALHHANDLLGAHFFTRHEPALLPDRTASEETDFDEFLRSPLI